MITNISVAKNHLERKTSAFNHLFGLDDALREIVVSGFFHTNLTVDDESPPARGWSRPRRLGAPLASGEGAFQPPLRYCAAGIASLEQFWRDHQASNCWRYERGRSTRRAQRKRAHFRKPCPWPVPLRYGAFTVHCAGAGRSKPTLKIDSWSPSARGWLDRNRRWKRLS